MISLLKIVRKTIPFLLMLILPLSEINASKTLDSNQSIQLAQQGNARDKMIQGLRFAMGDGCLPDDIKAELWFALAASENYAPAQVALASMKAFDSDVQDIPQAMELLRNAAKQNNLQAQAELIRLLDSGIGKSVTSDEIKIWQKESEALSEKRKLAKIWKLAATGAEKWQLQENLSDGTVRKQAKNVNTPVSSGIFLNISDIGHAVDDGNNVAKTVGAMLLATGNGIRQDTKLAQEWLMEAAKDGYAPAQAVVAQLYGMGWESFAKNEKAAAEWMKLAADQHLEEAEFQYAVMLLTGVGIATDRSQAIEILERLAQHGNAQAQLRLAFEKMAEGKRSEAVKLLSGLLENSDEQIFSVLGLLYGWGNAPVFNETAKMTEARRYAQRNDADAQLMVGLFYAEGWGTPRNIEESIKWYSSAIKAGNQDARIPLALLYASIGQSEVAEQMIVSSIKHKAFSFLHEKELLKMMFDQIDNVPEVKDMSAMEEGNNSHEYVTWRQSKILTQTKFIEKTATSGNPVAGYLQGLMLSENWTVADVKEQPERLLEKSLTKLCAVSSKGIEKECRQLKENQ